MFGYVDGKNEKQEPQEARSDQCDCHDTPSHTSTERALLYNIHTPLARARPLVHTDASRHILMGQADVGV